MARTRLDDEVLDLLADDPELRAIADAFAETQAPRRRVRPVGILVGVALVAAAALAFAFWSGGGSSGISGNTAYAGIGGAARLLRIEVVAGPRHVSLQYDRAHARLAATGQGRTVRVTAANLPPAATTLAPALRSGFGPDIALALSLLVEYPPLAKDGKLDDVSRPPAGGAALRWVSYRSALGYVVEVGLRPGVLKPLVVERAGSGTPVRVLMFSASG
jgi:hypothetical protein